ncbi:MAG: peptidase M20 [Kangiella sp.]|nr:MAG: peptidase M20 [Kangiella sp.]
MGKFLIGSIVILSSSCVLSNTKTLSDIEKQIVLSVESSFNSQVDFLEKVVNINSGTRNKVGVKAVGEVFIQAFNKLGFKSSWIDMPAKMDRAGHMLGERSFGAGGKKILLMGHLDTVFPINSPFQKFERTTELNGSKVKGPGVTDMKDGNTIILFALKSLIEGGFIKKGQVSVFFTGDEESSGKPISISRKDLIDVAKRSDLALNFEGGSPTQAVIGRRGTSNWTLTVTGKRSHSSVIFSDDVGAGAIFESGRILNDFYQQVKGEHGLTFNPGVIGGGTFVEEGSDGSSIDAYGKGNVVAQKVIVKGGLRFLSEEQKERARESMRQVIAKNLPMTQASIEFEDSYPAMTATDANRAELKKLSDVSVAIGMKPLTAYDPTKRGAADISFVAPYVTSLDALGSWGGNSHTPDEWLDLNTFEIATKRTAVYLYRLLNEK